MKIKILIIAIIALTNICKAQEIHFVSINKTSFYYGDSVNIVYGSNSPLPSNYELILRCNGNEIDTLTFSELQSNNFRVSFIMNAIYAPVHQNIHITMYSTNIIIDVLGFNPVTNVNILTPNQTILYFDMFGNEIKKLKSLLLIKKICI